MSLKIDVNVQTNDERVKVNMLPDVDLETHLNDKNNPHKVTPEQIGIAGCEAVSLPQLLEDGKITSDYDGTISVTENSIKIAPKESPLFGGIKIDIALSGFFDIEFQSLLASATVYVDDVFVGYVRDNGLSFCGNIEKSLTVEVGAVSGYWVGINRFDEIKGGVITAEDYYAFKNNGGGGGTSLPSVTSRDNDKVLTAENGKWVAKALPTFNGTFEVIPTPDNDVKLKTAGTYMDSDVTVKKIPYAEVSNESGGTTVTIGVNE